MVEGALCDIGVERRTPHTGPPVEGDQVAVVAVGRSELGLHPEKVGEAEHAGVAALVPPFRLLQAQDVQVLRP